MALPSRIVTCTYVRKAGTAPSVGDVIFRPEYRVRDEEGNRVHPPGEEKVELDSSGHISVTVLVGWPYKVTEHTDGTWRSYRFQVEAGDGPFDLADWVSGDPIIEPVVLVQGPPGEDGADGAPGSDGADGATGPPGPPSELTEAELVQLIADAGADLLIDGGSL